MDNEMMYKMFLNTLAKMDDTELNTALDKAKKLLSEKDYQALLSMVQKERTIK